MVGRSSRVVEDTEPGRRGRGVEPGRRGRGVAQNRRGRTTTSLPKSTSTASSPLATSSQAPSSIAPLLPSVPASYRVLQQPSIPSAAGPSGPPLVAPGDTAVSDPTQFKAVNSQSPVLAVASGDNAERIAPSPLPTVSALVPPCSIPSVATPSGSGRCGAYNSIGEQITLEQLPQIGVDLPLGLHVPLSLKEKIWNSAYFEISSLCTDTATSVVDTNSMDSDKLTFSLDGDKLVVKKPGSKS